MPKLTATFNTEKDVDLSAQNTGEGVSTAYVLVKPDFYTAVVQKFTVKTYRASYSTYTSDAPDGKWDYISLVPEFLLLNEHKTEINRQDFTLGVTKNSTLIRPDGNSKQSPIFGGKRGALFLLQSMSLIKPAGDAWSIDFDPELIRNRVIRVRTGVGAYVKGLSQRNLDAVELAKRLTDINGGDYTFDDIPALVDKLNEAEGFDPQGEVRYRTKNMVVSTYPLYRNQAQDYYFAESGEVFLTEHDYQEYELLKDGGSAPADKW